MVIVCKFGGSSLADAGQIRKVRDIIEQNEKRGAIVVSAPGKRSSEDSKVTDLLYTCAREAAEGRSIAGTFDVIRKRYLTICRELGMDEFLSGDLDEIEADINAGYGADYAASRGEYLSAKMLGVYFNAEFVDAADVIRLTEDGRVDSLSYTLVQKRLTENRRYIFPGFFGTDPSGRIKTFSRGGSDITGAIVSRAAGASVYENWTDVPGLMMADPRVFDNPPVVREITYREIRDLACVGAQVFHEEAIAPVRDRGIPINIRNTNNPAEEGTLIIASRSASSVPVAGISGKTGYTAVRVRKFMMNRHEGFFGSLETLFHNLHADAGFVFHGNDSIVFLIDEERTRRIPDLTEQLLASSVKPDSVDIREGIGVIGIVGEGLKEEYGKTASFASKVFDALDRKEIKLCCTSFGGSDTMFLLGVGEQNFSKALGNIYDVLKK